MTARRELPNKRDHHVIEFEFECARYVAGYSFFANGALAEVFLSAGKANCALDVSANSAAILCSISLQYGVPLNVIRHGLPKTHGDNAASALGRALDLIDASQYRTREHSDAS